MITHDKKAVVFGGSGFIGAHLVKSLVSEGYTVLTADLTPPQYEHPLSHYVPCDVRKPIKETPDYQGATVFNLAAVHRVPGHSDGEYFETNLLGATNIVNYCDAHDTETVVFTSSISIYGPSEQPLDESSSPHPISAYGMSKLAAESIHAAWQARSRSRRLIVARPGVVFGQGENGNFTKLAAALRRGTFIYPGRRDAVKACIYVEELISTIQFAQSVATPGAPFTYNACYPTSYTIEMVCDDFYQSGNVRRPLGTAPISAVLAAARLFESLDNVGIHTSIDRARVKKLTESTNIRPHVLLETGYTFESDLRMALARWSEAGPRGEYV